MSSPLPSEVSYVTDDDNVDVFETPIKSFQHPPDKHRFNNSSAPSPVNKRSLVSGDSRFANDTVRSAKKQKCPVANHKENIPDNNVLLERSLFAFDLDLSFGPSVGITRVSLYVTAT